MEIKGTLDSPRLKKLPPTQLFFGSKKSICFNQTRKVWHPGNSGHNTGLCLKITHVHHIYREYGSDSRKKEGLERCLGWGRSGQRSVPDKLFDVFDPLGKLLKAMTKVLKELKKINI